MGGLGGQKDHELLRSMFVVDFYLQGRGAAVYFATVVQGCSFCHFNLGHLVKIECWKLVLLDHKPLTTLLDDLKIPIDHLQLVFNSLSLRHSIPGRMMPTPSLIHSRLNTFHLCVHFLHNLGLPLDGPTRVRQLTNSAIYTNPRSPILSLRHSALNRGLDFVQY